MYYIKKVIEIAGAHKLNLDYDSKCNNLHGHNWIITIYCCSEKLNKSGMVVDFTKIKKIVNQLDHKNLNFIIKQPTAENIAKWLCNKIDKCYRVDVEESKNNIATYVNTEITKNYSI